MSFNVLFLVCGLVEDGFAALHGALEGLLPCVNAEVVEQIVPFWKQLVAAFVIAKEGSSEAGFGRSNVLNHYELLGGGNMSPKS